MPYDDPAVLRASRRAQDEAARLLKKGRRPARGTKIPVLTADPPFEQGINLWMDPDGNLRSYTPDGTKYEYGKTAVTAASGTIPVQFQPETLQKTYWANWGVTICGTHGLENGDPGIWYGDSPDLAHVDRKLMIGLPDDTIRLDLANADIELVELTANNLTAELPNVSLHWGLHLVDFSPTDYSAMRKDAHVDWWPKVGPGTAPWRRVHDAFGDWLKNDEAEGLTIDQPAGVGNSGQLDWRSVGIRITYTITS